MEKIISGIELSSPQPKLGKSGYGGFLGALGSFHEHGGASLAGKAGAVGDTGHMDTQTHFFSGVVQPCLLSPGCSVKHVAQCRKSVWEALGR